MKEIIVEMKLIVTPNQSKHEYYQITVDTSRWVKTRKELDKTGFKVVFSTTANRKVFCVTKSQNSY